MPVFVNRFHLCIREHVDVFVVSYGGHLRCGDAAAAVEGGENLAEGDHLAPDAGVFFNQRYLIALVGKVQRGLHAGDPSADYERVNIKNVSFHNSIPGLIR